MMMLLLRLSWSSWSTVVCNILLVRPLVSTLDTTLIISYGPTIWDPKPHADPNTRTPMALLDETESLLNDPESWMKGICSKEHDIEAYSITWQSLPKDPTSTSPRIAARPPASAATKTPPFQSV